MEQQLRESIKAHIKNVALNHRDIGALKVIEETMVNDFLSILKEKKEAIEKLRRTDDTQMSHDHVYDEAIDDVIRIIENE